MPADPYNASTAAAITADLLRTASEASEQVMLELLTERSELRSGTLRGSEHLSAETAERMIGPRYAGLGSDLERACQRFLSLREMLR
jgi:hypothetical protein